MSFSNPTLQTPSKKFFKWKGGIGEIVWYDKESETELTVTKPFRFIVLDQLTTIKGYSDLNQSGIWSNEVRNIRRDVLYVKSKGGDIATGTYEQIKDKLKAGGGKFAQSVYIAYQQSVGEDFEWTLGNINISGAALGEWFTFSKKANLQTNGVSITGKTEDKKGATKFFVPVFETWKLEDSHFNIGINLDTELQKYLTTYLEKRDSEVGEFDKDIEIVKEIGDAKSEDVILEDIDDKPIDLSEIPF